MLIKYFCQIYVILGKGTLHKMLFTLVKEMAKRLDTSGLVRTDLMDHGKTYNSLLHDLLVSKLSLKKDKFLVPIF